MCNNLIKLFLSFAMLGCATRVYVPNSAVREYKYSGKIYVSGLNKEEFSDLENLSSQYQLVENTLSQMFSTNDTCVALAKDNWKTPAYKTVISTLTLSFYAYYRVSEVKVSFSNCASKEIIYETSYTEVKYFGILMPILPISLESNTRVNALAIDHIVRSQLHKFK